MKKFSPQLLPLNKIISGKKKIFIPPYQRKYSWEETQWEKFTSTITSFIENREIEEEDEVFFIGQIIFNREKDTWTIIDGQQRLVTSFLFLLTFLEFSKYSEINFVKKEDLTWAEDKILRILFNNSLLPNKEMKLENCSLGNSRIKFSDQKDNEDYHSILEGLLAGKEQIQLSKLIKRETSNLQGVRIHFTKNFLPYLEEEKRIEFLAVILDKLSFIEIDLTKEEDIVDLFVALNETGLNLSQPDLIRVLFIKLIGGENELRVQELAEEWDEKVVSVVSEAKNRGDINNEVNDYLYIFWRISFGRKGKISKHGKLVWASENNIYELFLFKLKEENYPPSQLFREIIKCAFIYSKIRKLDKDYWINNNWPKFFYEDILTNIPLVKLDLLFPLILRIEVNHQEKKINDYQLNEISLGLKKLFLCLFRDKIIREVSASDIIWIIDDLVQKIRERNFFVELTKEDFLNEKFTEEINKDFYIKLESWYPTTAQRNLVLRYIFSQYYLTKHGKIRGMETKIEDKIQIEHLIAKKSDFSIINKNSKEWKETVNSLGNITLLIGVDNRKIKNKPWLEKKKILQGLKAQCLLSLEAQDSPIFLWKKEPTIEDIKERSKKLVKEFQELKLFEV